MEERKYPSRSCLGGLWWSYYLEHTIFSSQRSSIFVKHAMFFSAKPKDMPQTCTRVCRILRMPSRIVFNDRQPENSEEFKTLLWRLAMEQRDLYLLKSLFIIKSFLKCLWIKLCEQSHTHTHKKKKLATVGQLTLWQPLSMGTNVFLF